MADEKKSNLQDFQEALAAGIPILGSLTKIGMIIAKQIAEGRTVITFEINDLGIEHAEQLKSLKSVIDRRMSEGEAGE